MFSVPTRIETLDLLFLGVGYVFSVPTRIETKRVDKSALSLLVLAYLQGIETP